jgi:hypothetical protein
MTLTDDRQKGLDRRLLAVSTAGSIVIKESPCITPS